MASEVLYTVSQDEIEEMRQFSKHKYELDRQSELVYAKEEGMLKIVNLLKSGVPPEEIIRDYGDLKGELL